MLKETSLPDDATLLAIPLFSELSEHELEGIRTMCRVKKFKKNAMIFFEQDTYTGLYAVLQGSVKIYKITPEGKEFIVHLMYPYSLIGDVPMFGEGAYPANAQALESSTLLFLPKTTFLEYLQRTPALTNKLLAGFSKRIRSLSQQLENITLHDVSCRFARFLIVHLEEDLHIESIEPMIRLRSTKSSIAAHLGTTIETLSRTLRALQSDNIIELNGTAITILDYPLLRKLAEYPPAALHADRSTPK